MNDALTKVRTVLLAASAATVFGFGAAQAFAAPATSNETARACTDSVCNSKCKNAGELGGSCSSVWSCECF